MGTVLYDLTLRITQDNARRAGENEKIVLSGHLGTHFDVMDSDFPLEFTTREAVVFDVRNIRDRDIDVSDIDITRVGKGYLAAFCSGYTSEKEYGSREYFSSHPTLSHALIDALLERKVSIIGIDFPGVRRGSEHTPADRYASSRGTFIVENLAGLESLLPVGERMVIHTYPMSWAGVTGLPCRVVAEI